jgi:hypothetical protein
MNVKQFAAIEYAENIGRQRPELAWILSDYDTWHANPFYTGPKMRHPEDDQYENESVRDLPLLATVESQEDADLPF